MMDLKRMLMSMATIIPTMHILLITMHTLHTTTTLLLLLSKDSLLAFQDQVEFH